jgi:hypothetical protein
MKSKSVRLAVHIARMREKKNAYTLLVGKPEGKRPLGRPGSCFLFGFSYPTLRHELT